MADPIIRGDPLPYLSQFARDTGIPEANLIEGFALERLYHERICNETDPEQRRALSRAIYEQVHQLFAPSLTRDAGNSPFSSIVALFRRELRARSVLDVGCGTGTLLMCIRDRWPGIRLIGLDASSEALPEGVPGITFQEADIIDFDMESPVEVVVSHHVLEHIAPRDVGTHLDSVARALIPGGHLIVCAPNRLFGPWDVTRIVDYTYSNRVPAIGSHLNELSYGETVSLLREYGFTGFQAVLPVPKLTSLLGGIRVSPAVVTALERRPALLWVLYHLPARRRWVGMCEVRLVCRRPV